MIGVGFQFSVGQRPYTIAEAVSMGGMAVVFRAAPDDGIGASLAVKVPLPEIQTDEVWIRKFRREIRILANISHPNVVKVVGAIEVGDRVALVQEFVRGARELNRCLAGGEAAQQLSWILQVLYGLRATHGVSEETRTVHRDLSPRNILIDESNCAKIIDFGMAKEEIRKSTILTRRSEVFGTPGCIAPEQYDDPVNVDHRADIYAFGRTIAACLQECHPEHVDLRDLVPPWEALVSKMVERRRDRRFSDAEEAICAFLHTFRHHGVLPADLPFHAGQFSSWPSPPSEWASVVRAHFDQTPALTSKDLTFAMSLSSATLQDGHIDVNLLFHQLCRGPLATFVDGGPQNYGMYDDSDSVGDFLLRLLWMLAPDYQPVCFRLLVRCAVRFHRYRLMGHVRSVFGDPRSASLRSAWLELLNAEDPGRVIHSFSAIPR